MSASPTLPLDTLCRPQGASPPPARSHPTPATTAVPSAPTSGDGPRFKLKVLRERCKDCADGPQKATGCDFDGVRQELCPLWDYRTGHRPKGRKAKWTPLRALRAYCLWCCDDQPREVRLCPAVGCPLWPWRRGRATGEVAPPPAEADVESDDEEAPATGEATMQSDALVGEPGEPCQPSPPEGTPPGLPADDWFARAFFCTEVEAACLAAGQVVERLCRGCGEEPLPPRKQLCSKCQRANSRATKRRAQAKWRCKRQTRRPV